MTIPNTPNANDNGKYTKKTALIHLRSLKLDELRHRYKNAPEYGLCTPNYNDTTTNGLTRCLLDFLRLNGCQAERISNEGRIRDNRKTITDVMGHTKTIGSIQRIKSSGQLGTADISATIQGRSVKIEVKNENTKERQRQAQIEYQRQVEAAGGIYCIATSFSQFLNWFYATIEKIQL